MEILKWLIVYGAILFVSGLVLIVLMWPYALAEVETEMAYPVASGIIFIIIIIIEYFTCCIDFCSKHN